MYIVISHTDCLQLYTAKSQYWLHKAGASPEHWQIKTNNLLSMTDWDTLNVLYYLDAKSWDSTMCIYNVFIQLFYKLDNPYSEGLRL